MNFTLGIIAFGVGIGYDLILINISKNSAIDSMRVRSSGTLFFLFAVQFLMSAIGCILCEAAMQMSRR